MYLTNTLALHADYAEYGFTLNFWSSITSLVLIGCFIFILSQMTKSHFDKFQIAQVQQKISTLIPHVEASEVKDKNEQNKEEQESAHDFQNSLCALSGYIHSKQYSEALTAIQKMHHHPICNLLPITGLPPIDSVFAEKKQLAEDKEIKLMYAIILFEVVDTFDAMDLAIIIANGLDNAIEASLAIDDSSNRMVLCSLSTQDHHIMVKIQNRTVKNISIPPSLRLVTSKADSANHGLGLSSIHRLAAKHHGTLALSCEDQIFTLEVILPLEIDRK